jgi:hypothetical protein
MRLEAAPGSRISFLIHRLASVLYSKMDPPPTLSHGLTRLPAAKLSYHPPSHTPTMTRLSASIQTPLSTLAAASPSSQRPKSPLNSLLKHGITALAHPPRPPTPRSGRPSRHPEKASACSQRNTFPRARLSSNSTLYSLWTLPSSTAHPLLALSSSKKLFPNSRPLLNLSSRTSVAAEEPPPSKTSST